MKPVSRDVRSKVSMPWLLITLLFIAFIWGNSMVPGDGSGALSLGAMEMIRRFLASLGLPFEWVTNFVVRKAAHFTEYFILGTLASQAFDPERRASRVAIAASAFVCVLVPSIDETIQLFVSGRAGRVADVLLDCCGAAAGIGVRSLFVRKHVCL